MKINFEKLNGLVPVIVQDSKTDKVLMLGFMNAEAYEKTIATKKVTFYSRTRKTIWTKGETSGNFLEPDKILIDCDNDTLLVKANPTGPTCHTGDDTCFKEKNKKNNTFLFDLEKVIQDRKKNPTEKSYTSKLFDKGIRKIAQKVGEEATEVIIDAIDNNTDLLKEETSDLLYHLLVLLAEKNITLNEVMDVLEKRHK